MTEVLERERKWEVDDDFVLPSLDDIVPGGEVEHSTIELTSAYFDTADRDLSAHGLLLRRREGDDDTGWQLKMPDSNGRIEIHYPLSDTMPSDLSALLTGVSLGSSPRCPRPPPVGTTTVVGGRPGAAPPNHAKGCPPRRCPGFGYGLRSVRLRRAQRVSSKSVVEQRR